MSSKLAVLVSSIKPSVDCRDLIIALNEVADNTNVDCSLFCLEQVGFPITPLYGVYHMYDFFAFDGIAIATNLETARHMGVNAKAKKRFLYVQNLEWTNGGNYNDLYDIYSNIDLIAKTQEEAELIENAWKKPVMVMEKFNSKQLLKLGA